MFRHQLFVDTSNYETHYLPLYSNQLVKGKVERLAGNLRWEFWEKLDNESSGDVKTPWALTDAEYQWKIEPVFHNMRSIVLPWNYKKCSSAHIRRIETNDAKSVERKILGRLIHFLLGCFYWGNCVRVYDAQAAFSLARRLFPWAP